MAGSVELGTIYLVDLVGSTRLEMSVGPVRADALREEFFGLLREAIGATGGHEFKNTGDGLLVAFSSASGAVGCAVLTQQLFERRYRGAEQPLHVRIGLGTGELTLRDGDYFGAPAIEAARLCDQAPVDCILASPLTRALAGRVDGARFESFGELELKGIPEPMEAFSVVWEPLDPEQAGDDVGRWPLPEALRVVPRIPYVGRENQRARLEDVCGRARAGARQAVLLSGEPGIGKTRLASYLALGANADGFGVCWGGCSEELAAPYEPWIAVCTQVVEHAPEPLLAEYVEKFGGEIGRLARNLRRRLPDAPQPQSSDPDTERFLLFQGVGELLRAVSRSVPLCVVLDDVHWADGQTLALLKHVVRNVEHSALQVLVTYRDTDIGKDHPLTAVLADLHRLEGIERVALTGLRTDEVAAMLSAAAGHDVGADGLALAGHLAAEAGGNPFFIGEMLRELTESGAIAFDAASGRWDVDRAALSDLPQSVRDVIDHRVDRLAGAREVLTVASVIGRSFDVALLAGVAGMGEARVLDVLDAAVTAALLHESTEHVGRFVFEHALINTTLYEGLGATRRARIHSRVAEALEALDDAEERLADLALHWRLGTMSANANANANAAVYSVRAGRQALDSLAPSEAGRRFADAIDLLGPGVTADRFEALIGLGEAQRLTGDARYRDTLLDASRVASVLGDGQRAARAALANTRGQTSVYGHIDHERLEAIERALELDADADRRARLLSMQARELLYERDQRHRQELAEEALSLARGLGNPRTTAQVLIDWFRIFQTPTGLHRRAELLEEFAAAARASGDPVIDFWATSLIRNVLIESGDVQGSHQGTARMGAIAQRLGEPTLLWVNTYCGEGCVALLRGDLAEAERCADRALQLGSEAGQPDATMLHGSQIIPIRILQGRAAEILELLAQVAAANPMIPAFRAAHAQALCAVHRHDEAAAIVARAAADRFGHLPWEQTRAAAHAMYADVAAQAGVTDAAEILYELLEPSADQIVWNGANTFGHVRMYLGLLAATLGRDDLADGHLAWAIEFQERAGMLVWAARAHLGWAEALAVRGEADEARHHAGRALALARDHGYGGFEPRAVAILSS